MDTSQSLFVAGAATVTFAGGVHGLLALIDTVRPTFFAPTHTLTAAYMESAGIRFVPFVPRRDPDRPSIWRLWLGFNLTHSAGILAFGIFFLLIGRRDFTFVSDSGYVYPFAFAVLSAYLLISLRFFFYLPTFVIAGGLGCFIASCALN